MRNSVCPIVVGTYCEQHSLRPSGPTKPMQDWPLPATFKVPQAPLIEVAPVGIGTGLDDPPWLKPGAAGVESRYQFAGGSFIHSPTVTAVRPLE